MQSAGWLEEGEAESVSIATRKTADEHEIKGEPGDTSVEPRGGMEIDSEGGAQEVSLGNSDGSGQERLHVDGLREGVLYITAPAEVHHARPQKSSAEGSDLISAVSKKASVPVTAWDVIDLEPECTLFSSARRTARTPLGGGPTA